MIGFWFSYICPGASKRNDVRYSQRRAFDFMSKVQSYSTLAGLIKNKTGEEGVKCNASFRKVIPTLNFSLSTTSFTYLYTNSNFVKNHKYS